MTIRSPLLASAAALAALIPGVPVSAQCCSSVPGWHNYSTMRQHFSDRAVRRATNPRATPRTITRLRPAPPARPAPRRTADGAIVSGSTSFRPQAAELMPALLAAQMGRDPADRARIERELSQTLAHYRARLRASGGPQTDVSRAAAYLISASHQAYFGRSGLSDSQFAAVRRQMQEQFATNPAFQRKNDRDRQLEFEFYAIMGTMVDSMSASLDARSSAKDRDQVHRLARENFIGMTGVPPERAMFSEAGMTIR